MAKQKERWAILVDGIELTGYDSGKEAQDDIDVSPGLGAKNAVSAKLSGKPHENPITEEQIKLELRIRALCRF